MGRLSRTRFNITEEGYDESVGMYGKPAAGTPTEHGFYSFSINNSFTDDDVTCIANPHSAYSWAARAPMCRWISVPMTKSESVIGGQYSTYTPGIAKAINLHSGTAQFWKQIDQVLDFPDPPGGFPGMYLSRADTEALITAIAERPGCREPLSNTCATRTQFIATSGDAFADVTNAKAAALVQSNFDFLTWPSTCM